METIKPTMRELYNIVSSIKGKEIDDFSLLIPVLEDIRDNEPCLFDRFRKMLNVYKRNLAERVMDNRQSTLNFENEEEL